jgi:hypothetical protein
VEIDPECAHDVLAKLASMGPRFSGRGNPCRRATIRSRSALQWGHGFQAVEIWARSTRSWRTTRLQWGHGFQAVEM